MADTRALAGTASTSSINSLLASSWQQQAEVAMNMRIRRMLVSRDRSVAYQNQTGTLLPPPFNETSLAIRSMIGEASKAVHIAASRITANTPDIAVIPLSPKDEIGTVASREAGMQERLDAQLFYENGGVDCQWEAAWAKSIGGAAFYLTLPRDADFGLPDRLFYDESDEELEALRRIGKVSSVPRTLPSGRMVYAEHGDVWAARRRGKMREQAEAGRSLFTLQVYPRDMVLKERDRESRDLKWAAIVEEIPAVALAAGSDFARSVARAKGITADDQGLWGVFWDTDKKRIIGGIAKGGPLDSAKSAQDAFTLIRFFNREEQVILVAPRGSVQGATEIWRGKHGCTVQGAPACPVVEDPFYRTDVNVTGKEYATALDPVFGYVPLINQVLTVESNAAMINGIPRMVGDASKAPDGAPIRGVDGQPATTASTPVPGLDPREMAVYPFPVSQLLINEESLRALLVIYFERLEAVMPTLGGDASGADAAAWAIQMRIQEGQQPYQKPVANSCQAITGIVQRWHGWMRQLDVPVYFFAAPGHRKSRQELRGLIEFDPKHLTDSIRVTQSLDTPSESTIRIQVGMELWQAGLIDDEEFYDKYAREQDSRDAVIRRYVQATVNYVVLGQMPLNFAPGGIVQPVFMQVADGVRGEVHYELINGSEDYAWSVARNMASQAQAMAVGTQTQQTSPSVAEVTGARVPGVGMAPSLPQQLGGAASGAQTMPAPVAAV